MKYEKCFVYYATESYFEIAKKSIESVRKYTNLPICLYLLNSDLKLDIQNTITINWNCNINFDNNMYEIINDNFYINRKNKNIYNILIQRPLIVKDCLEKYSEEVCYVDCDSIATPYIENIFNYYNGEVNYPYFVQGLYEYLNFYERGGLPIDEIQSNTLEYPLCKLLNTNQKNRKFYRQTGYFVSNQNCVEFLNEWYNTCVKKEILENPEYYAPYHEETVVNVLLWKYNYQGHLPYLYVNGSLDRVDEIYNKIKFNGYNNLVSVLYKIPKDKETLLFFHGEKRIDVMVEMIESIEKNYKTKILFLAPHLSTGGMPSFLLKRIKEILKHDNHVEIFVVEYSYYGPAYVVQRNEIINIIGEDRFFELGEDKDKIIEILKENNIDILHIDENIEMLTPKLSKKTLDLLYSDNRNYRIIETCHNIWFDANNNKFYNPDGYIFCTPWHIENTFSTLESPSIVAEFPIENKKPGISKSLESKLKLNLDPNKIHIINVGLWTENKNQRESIEVAKLLEKTNPEIEFHFIGNQAPNFQNYWDPIMLDIPTNVKVWGERDDVELFMESADILLFNSVLECNPLVIKEAISHRLKIIARNLPQYNGMYDDYIFPIYSNNIEELKKLILYVINNKNKFETVLDENYSFYKKHIDFYDDILKKPCIKQKQITSRINIIINFLDGPFVEILGESLSDYDVKIYNLNNKCVYENKIKTNHWVKLHTKYFYPWRIEIYEDGRLIHNEKISLKDKKVHVVFDSSSLGDGLSWVPYCEEFMKKNECELFVSTFMNEMFIDQYPEIKFVNRDTKIKNLYAKFNIGWYYDENNKYRSDLHPYDPKSQPLQKTSSDILNLEFKEIKPKIKYPRLPKRKKVGIGIHGTTQAKYWNNKNGWQEVVDYLINLGYEVVIYSKENDGYMGNYHPKGARKFKEGSLRTLINDMVTCEFFIGIGSGLSWLAWSLNLPVVLISGFSEKWTETQSNTYRVINDNVCHGCFNMCRLEANDWNWCPMLKNTDRMFECSKSITSNMVIEKINGLIENHKSVL